MSNTTKRILMKLSTGGGAQILFKQIEFSSVQDKCILTLQQTQSFSISAHHTKVFGLAAWSENYKWYSSLPLGAVVSLFVSHSSEFCRHKTLCVAFQRVFIVVSVYFVIDSVRKLLDTPSYRCH
jgi:hypothetical protein